MTQDLNIALVVRANAEQARREMAATGEAVREVGATAQASGAQAARGIAAIGQASNAARAHVTNLSFQINDVAMMMAMGQNPFMLAMQQGTQVSQVLDQMRESGMSLGGALVGAFTRVINPVSLATLAVIGFGAAAVKWFTGAGEKAQSLGDTVGDLARSVRDYRSAAEQALAPAEKLRQEWGWQATEAQALYAAMSDLSRLDALEGLGKAQAKLAADSVDGMRSILRSLDALRVSMRDESGRREEVLLERLQERFGVTEEQARRLAVALDALGKASGPQAAADAAAAARVEFMAIANAMPEISEEFSALGHALFDAEENARRLLVPLNQAGAEATTHAQELNSAWGNVLAAIRAAVAAAPGSGWLNGAIADAAALASSLWNAATAKAAATGGTGGTPATAASWAGDDTQALMRQYGNRGAAQPWQRSISDQISVLFPGAGKPGARSPGGGGATAEANAAQELLKAQENELALLRTLDPVQRAVIENRDALAAATAEEADQIRENIAQLERMREVRQVVDEVGAAGRNAFVGLATGAMSFTDALNSVLAKLAELAASTVWDAIWNGEGGLGQAVRGVIEKVIPGQASGGQVQGVGGPREDNQLRWLSVGEYVVNAAATRANLPLLEAINRGTPAMELLKGLAVAPRLANGGLVGGASFVSALPGRGSAGAGAAAAAPRVEVHNYSGQPIRQQVSEGPDGEALVTLVVGRELARGRFDGAQRARYGSRPEVGRR